MRYKHLFGPVGSRRLGVSLGIDLVPHKTCTLNCVYCECGKTTNLTLERREYIPTDEILNELNNYLGGSPGLDYITFSGSGEPTLHSRIGEIIDFLKRNYPQYKIAVLTNGTLYKNLRDEIKNADLVIPSLDAASDELFRKINRPQRELDINKIMDGLIELRKEFSGEIWLEVFIVPGLNDTDDQLQLLKRAIKKIKPGRIQLNTLDRPGAEGWVIPARKEDIEKIARFLDAEIIAEFTQRKRIKGFSRDIEDNIISILKRRPCTARDLSEMLGMHLNEVNKYLRLLIKNGKINCKEEERGMFFKTELK